MGWTSAASYPNEKTGSSPLSNEQVGSAPGVISKSSEPFTSTNGKGQNPQLDSSASLSLKDRIQKLEQRLLEVQYIYFFFLSISFCAHVVSLSDQL